jgi:MFS family permease
VSEPDVTLTDYALALECAVLTALALRWPARDESLRRWWAVFFASIGAASLLGGPVHGFFNAPGNSIRAILWPATILAIGVTSTAIWIAGAHVQLREPARSWVRRAAIALLLVYTLVVLFVSSRFFVAIAAYLPAVLFLLVAMVLAYRRHRQPALAYGILGLALTFVAAAVQQLRIAIHPTYFNHNALYHVIQGVALFLIFLGAKWTSTSPSTTRSGA